MLDPEKKKKKENPKIKIRTISLLSTRGPASNGSYVSQLFVEPWALRLVYSKESFPNRGGTCRSPSISCENQNELCAT